MKAIQLVWHAACGVRCAACGVEHGAWGVEEEVMQTCKTA